MNSLQEVYLDKNPFPSWESVKEAKSLKNLSLINCNAFSNPIPDLSRLQSLRLFNVIENQLTGVVPPSFTGLTSLAVVNLTNNCFQGPTPLFENSLAWDTCSGSNVTLINLGREELTGTISPSLAKLTSLETIFLSNNQLTGSIPTELTTLPRLRTLEVQIS
uniref:Leucine-rich repeat-containing N-terminal plant-type domain-containing protein n=1 Tax=Brassica oleracea var. oleracea TaxID=109376 RepID=A0A0D3DA69_BRAOL